MQTQTPVGIFSNCCLEGLLRHAIVAVETVGEGLVVLVGSVLAQHLLAGGALEVLEAGLALDGLGGEVLRMSVCFSALSTYLRNCLRISIGSLPPLGPSPWRDRAFAVLCWCCQC